METMYFQRYIQNALQGTVVKGRVKTQLIFELVSCVVGVSGGKRNPNSELH